MFSGIIEAQSNLLKQWSSDKTIRIEVERPSHFDDLKIGDSVCINGVCLTIEKFDHQKIQFCLGSETLQVLGAGFDLWARYPLNLERSMKLGDRVHGHLVTGHVDGQSKILKSNADGECWQLRIEVSDQLIPYFWKKGSVCLNGVSLTVNDIQKIKNANWIEVCLIPETIQKMNLKFYQAEQYVNIESDYLAKAFVSNHSYPEGPSR